MPSKVNHVMGFPQPAWIGTVMNDSRAETTRSSIDQLTRAMARGDEPAFREFHELYFDRLLRYSVVITFGDEEAAKDAVQEAYLRVVRHVRAFADEHVFWSWLTVLARSAVRDAGRKKQSYWRLLRTFAQSLLISDASSQREDSFEEPYLAMLDRSLAGLAPTDRDLIEAKYFRGASVRELAEAGNVTEKAVESRLLRARRQLKESLLRQRRRNDETAA